MESVDVRLLQPFEDGRLTVISEQDILGDRLIRKPSRKKRAENFLTEAQSLSPGPRLRPLPKRASFGTWVSRGPFGAARRPRDGVGAWLLLIASSARFQASPVAAPSVTQSR